MRIEAKKMREKILAEVDPDERKKLIANLCGRKTFVLAAFSELTAHITKLWKHDREELKAVVLEYGRTVGRGKEGCPVALPDGMVCGDILTPPKKKKCEYCHGFVGQTSAAIKISFSATNQAQRNAVK